MKPEIYKLVKDKTITCEIYEICEGDPPHVLCVEPVATVQTGVVLVGVGGVFEGTDGGGGESRMLQIQILDATQTKELNTQTKTSDVDNQDQMGSRIWSLPQRVRRSGVPPGWFCSRRSWTP